MICDFFITEAEGLYKVTVIPREGEPRVLLFDSADKLMLFVNSIED